MADDIRPYKGLKRADGIRPYKRLASFAPTLSSTLTLYYLCILSNGIPDALGAADFFEVNISTSIVAI